MCKVFICWNCMHIYISLWDQQMPIRTIIPTLGSSLHLEAAVSDEAALRRCFRNTAATSSCHSWIKLSPLFHCQTMMLYDVFFWGATLEPFLFGMRWPNDNIFHACASSATQRKSPTQSQVKIVICFQVATLWSLKTWRVHLSHPQAIPTSQPNGCLSAKALWAGVRPWRWLRWNLEGLQLGGSGSWEMGKHGMNKTKCWWTYLRILGNVNEIWAYNEPSYDNTTMVIMLAKKMQRTMLGKSHPVFSTSRTFWGFPQSQKIDDAILEAAPTLTPLNGQMAMGHAGYIQSAGSTGAGAGFQINTVSDGFSVYHYRLFQKNSESLH